MGSQPTRYEILQHISGNPGFHKGQIATLNGNDARNLLAAGAARVYKSPEDIAEELLEQRRPDIERAAIVSHLANLGLDYDGNPLPPREDAEGEGEGSGKKSKGGKGNK